MARRRSIQIRTTEIWKMMISGDNMADSQDSTKEREVKEITKETDTYVYVEYHTLDEHLTVSCHSPHENVDVVRKAAERIVKNVRAKRRSKLQGYG